VGLTVKVFPEMDADGHLKDLRDWSEAVAEEIAQRAGLVELTAEHWYVVRLARAFYERTGVVPAMRPLVKLVYEHLGSVKGNSLFLLRLFPGSPARLVAKIAGLPRPTNCI
jgi:tRNA 2-thiouridine synthesizing protein E